jgi:thiol-disulfide isomerase/thioredoxin
MRKIFLTAVLMLFPISVWAQSSQQGQSLTLEDIQGRRFSLSDYKRKVVLLNFWATWCPPCRTEIPELIKMQRQYRTQGLRIVGITYPPREDLRCAAFSAKTKNELSRCSGNQSNQGPLYYQRDAASHGDNRSGWKSTRHGGRNYVSRGI